MGLGRHEKRPIPDRFWAKVEKTEGCWLWQGSTNGKPGYGIFRAGPERDARGSLKWVLAHRYAYEQVVGPIPSGMEIDHVRSRGCISRKCVNPAHLEPVNHRDNTLRSDGPSARAARRNACGRGHAYTPENLHMSGGKRRCRICDRAKEARRVR